MKKILRDVVHHVPGIGSILKNKHRLFVHNQKLESTIGKLEADIRTLNDIADEPRNFIAHHFISGKGIEIGAAHHPVKMPATASVKYVDMFSAEDLRKAFPNEYAKADLVHIDVVDDGEKLVRFKNNSLDFIIANHFLEHCLNPIGTLLMMYKKLRKNGTLYMAIPDMRYTFDRKRPLTTYQHLLDEHHDKTGKRFRKTHTEEFIKLAAPLDEHFSKAPSANLSAEEQVRQLLNSDYRIHYHVWTQKQMTELFVRIAEDFNIDLEVEALIKNRHEVIYIARKLSR